MKADHSSLAELRRAVSFLSFLEVDNDIMQVIIDNPELREPGKEALLESFRTPEYRFLFSVFSHLEPSMAEVFRWIKKIGIEAFLAPLGMHEREVLCRLYGLQGREKSLVEDVAPAMELPLVRIVQLESRAIGKLRHPQYDMIDGLKHGGVRHGPTRDLLAEG